MGGKGPTPSSRHCPQPGQWRYANMLRQGTYQVPAIPVTQTTSLRATNKDDAGCAHQMAHQGHDGSYTKPPLRHSASWRDWHRPSVKGLQLPSSLRVRVCPRRHVSPGSWFWLFCLYISLQTSYPSGKHSPVGSCTDAPSCPPPPVAAGAAGQPCRWSRMIPRAHAASEGSPYS